MISSINLPHDLSNFPDEIGNLMINSSSSQANHVSEISSDTIHDWHMWKNVAKALHADRKIPLTMKIDDVLSDEIKLDFYKNVVDNHYMALNQSFMKFFDEYLNEKLEEIDDKKIKKDLPTYKKGPFVHAQYNRALREFIQLNKDKGKYKEIFDDILFRAAEESVFPLVKMLLEEGVKPEIIQLEEGELHGEEKNLNLESLSWVSLMSYNPYNLYDSDFVTCILQAYPIDAAGLTYILWLMTQNSEIGHKEQKLEVMKILLEHGATLDSHLIAHYPPLVAKEMIPSFNNYPYNFKPM